MTDSSITQPFVEIPVSKNSLSRVKIIYGVGINDSTYVVAPVIKGVQAHCPYYRKWKDMLKRCYCNKIQKKQPTYVGCTVSDEWLLFSNFRRWMETQDWQGKELDKDIICPENKLYSKDTCVFVSHDINVLILDSRKSRGDFPIGVSRRAGKYRSQCNYKGKAKHLGTFKTPEEAHKAYCEYKASLIIKIANEQTDPRIKTGLLKHVDILLKTAPKIK